MDTLKQTRSAGERGGLAWLVLRESARSFGANRSLEAAATLAYYGFLSLMPLLLLAVFLLGLFMGSSDAVFASVRSAAAALFPTFDEAVLRDLVALARHKAWGLVTVVLLLWSMTPFAGALRAAVARSHKAERRMNVLLAKGLDLAAVLALLLLYAGVAAWRALPAHAAAGAAHPAAAALASFLLTAGVLLFVYAAFSPGRPGWLPLLAGALAAAALLSAIRPLFGLVLRYNPDYGYAFGSLKAVFLLLVWTYYNFAAILFGAEVLANTRRREALVLRGLLAGAPPAAGAAARLVGRFVRTCAAGEVLFAEGEGGREMFYVLSGAVELRKHDQVLRVMGPGDYFGEMSMLLGSPRTAAAVAAAADTRLVAIAQDNFELILRENPAIVQSILREMAQRLKATSDRL